LKQQVDHVEETSEEAPKQFSLNTSKKVVDDNFDDLFKI